MLRLTVIPIFLNDELPTFGYNLPPFEHAQLI
jgi:hypothetical protein